MNIQRTPDIGSMILYVPLLQWYYTYFSTATVTADPVPAAHSPVHVVFRSWNPSIHV